MKNIENIIDLQRKYFKEGNTLPIEFRIEALKKLKSIIENNEEFLFEALYKDLNKSPFEAYSTEIGVIYSEISYIIKNIKSWTKRKRVRTNLVNFKSKSYILKEPYGNTLIISPWNYPIFLTIMPLIGAIAAGNTAIMKVSRSSSNTSRALEQIINVNFPNEYIYVITGEAGTSEYLLEQKFDYIFYTGGIEYGKNVMKKASKFLTPVTLELGGKSPCIVDSNSDIPMVAKRIVWGKFINSGQTCVAPDYIYVDKSIKDELIKNIVYYIENMILVDRDNYPKIISEKHFNRLLKYLDNLDIIYDSGVDNHYQKIYPILVDEPDFNNPIMEEEIFGPILPILSYEKVDEAIKNINSLTKPLAAYIFSNNEVFIDNILHKIPFGGGCVNDTLMHLASPYLPFGGVGTSGMGSYHGKKSFDTFSHEKSILDKSIRIDLPFRYPPYNDKLKLVKKILK